MAVIEVLGSVLLWWAVLMFYEGGNGGLWFGGDTWLRTYEFYRVSIFYGFTGCYGCDRDPER